MIKISNYVRLILGAMAVISFTACLPTQANGQIPNLERFLKTADSDHDGILEPNEIPRPIKRELKKKGHSFNSRMKISDILNLVSKKKKPGTTKKPDTTKPVELKIPKFGVEASEKTGVQAFGKTTETIQYSEEITEKAQQVLEKYDRNKNNFLEEDEISSRRTWGAVGPYTHDKNGDRRLSLAELQARYQERHTMRENNNKNYENYENRSWRRRGDGGGRRGGMMVNGRQVFPENDQEIDELARDSKRKRNNSRTLSSSRSRTSDYESYVENYISGKDQNNNGVLDGDELSKVRSRAKYDTNKDGKIERQEMLDAISGASGRSNYSSDSYSSNSKISRFDRNRSSESRSGGKISSSFKKLDVNEDRLIQMNEFSKKWTKKQLDKFNDKDANGDGVISPDEW